MKKTKNGIPSAWPIIIFLSVFFLIDIGMAYLIWITEESKIERNAILWGQFGFTLFFFPASYLVMRYNQVWESAAELRIKIAKLNRKEKGIKDKPYSEQSEEDEITKHYG